MHAVKILFALALFAVLTPVASRAADLPVRYTVDEKQLKNAISGTNLTFELYSDATCTTLADSTVVTIDNVGIRERIKQFKPKSGAAQLKVVELHQTFLGVTATGNLFLKVTGTGVVAVGGACQAQAAAVAGGGGGGGGAVVKDGLGTVMGPSLDGASFLVSVGADLVRLAVLPTEYLYYNRVYFAGPGCTGSAYAEAFPSQQLFRSAFPFGATQYVIIPTSGAVLTPYATVMATTSPFNANSQANCDSTFGPGNSTFVSPHSCCVTTYPGGMGGPPVPGSSVVAPVIPQTLPPFTPPFTLDLP